MSEEPEDKTSFTDIFETVATGIPAPIRKNFFKAIGRLASAAVAIPIAKLEAYQREITENSKARVKLIKAQGDILATNAEIPEPYLEIANAKFAQRIVRQQLNIDIIAANAIGNINDSSNQNETSQEIDEIDDDWLNEFEDIAKNKSSDQVRTIFSRILSGEIQKPGTFSIKALKTLSYLDEYTANAFKNLCSLCICMTLTLPSSEERDLKIFLPYWQDLEPFWFLRYFNYSYDTILRLNDYELLREPSNVNINLETAFHENMSEKNFTTLKINGSHYYLKRRYIKSQITVGDYKPTVNCIPLTSIGEELFQIVDADHSVDYFEYLTAEFKSMDVDLIPYTKPKDL